MLELQVSILDLRVLFSINDDGRHALDLGFGEEALEDGGGVGTNMPAEMADYGVLFADGALASMRLLDRLISGGEF